MKISKPVFFRIILGITLIIKASSQAHAHELIVTRLQLLMGHVPVSLSLKIPAKQKEKAWQSIEKAFQNSRRWESIWSEYQAQSEVSCLNQKAGKDFCSLSPETLDLLKFSEELQQKTQGAFNIRFASPTPESREGKILLDLEKQRAKLVNPNTRINLNALAKGWILDQIINDLRAAGYDQAIVNGAGDLRAAGGPWKVAIQIPSAEAGKATHRRKIFDQAWASSGNYEQKKNIRDPRKGEIVVREGSVTVKSPSLLLSNALSTSLYVLGPDFSEAILEKFPEAIEIVWTSSTGKIKTFKNRRAIQKIQ